MKKTLQKTLLAFALCIIGFSKLNAQCDADYISDAVTSGPDATGTYTVYATYCISASTMYNASTMYSPINIT